MVESYDNCSVFEKFLEFHISHLTLFIPVPTNFNKSLSSLVKLTVSQLMLNPAPRGSAGQNPRHMNVGDFWSRMQSR